MTKSKGPRKSLALRLSPELFDLLTEFSELTGVSRHDYIVGVLEEAIPMMQRLVEIAKAAQSGGTANPYAMMSRLLADATNQANAMQPEIVAAASAQKRTTRKKARRNAR